MSAVNPVISIKISLMMHCAVCETIVIYFSGGCMLVCEISFHALYHGHVHLFNPLIFCTNFESLESASHSGYAYLQV